MQLDPGFTVAVLKRVKQPGVKGVDRLFACDQVLKQVAKAKSTYAPYDEATEKPCLLFDNTAFFSGADGLLLTNHKLYFNLKDKPGGKAKQGSLPLQQITAFEAKRAKIGSDLLVNGAHLGNIDTMSSETANTLTYLFAKHHSGDLVITEVDLATSLGFLTEKRPRKWRKRFVGLATFVAIGSTLSILAGNDSETISSADFGDDWPFTVKTGVLRCVPPRVVTLTVDDTTYALNGPALGRMKKEPSWRSAEEIQRHRPQEWGMVAVSYYNVIQRGLALCK